MPNAGYPTTHRDGLQVYKHRLIAEAALGRLLPDEAEVHHASGNKKDSGRSNLVICQDHGHHMLLHRRERALKACGHADWLKCGICRTYDDPENLYVYTNPRTNQTAGRHRACHAKRQGAAYHARRAGSGGVHGNA